VSIKSNRLHRGERKDDVLSNRRTGALSCRVQKTARGRLQVLDQAIAISVPEAWVCCDFHDRVIEGPSRRIDWVPSCLLHSSCLISVWGAPPRLPSPSRCIHVGMHVYVRTHVCTHRRTHVCIRDDDKELLINPPRAARTKTTEMNKKEGRWGRGGGRLASDRGAKGQGQTFSPMLPSFFFSLSIPALKPYPLPPPDEPAMP